MTPDFMVSFLQYNSIDYVSDIKITMEFFLRRDKNKTARYGFGYTNKTDEVRIVLSEY